MKMEARSRNKKKSALQLAVLVALVVAAEGQWMRDDSTAHEHVIPTVVV